MYVGMTRGTFYAHFSSKNDIYQQALLNGAKNSQLVQAKPDTLSEKERVDYLVKGYLSEHYIQQKTPPCPLAFLVTDVAVRAPKVRHTYTKIFKDINKIIHASVQSFSDCEQEHIYAVTAMMIGAVAIGRPLIMTRPEQQCSEPVRTWPWLYKRVTCWNAIRAEICLPSWEFALVVTATKVPDTLQ